MSKKNLVFIIIAVILIIIGIILLNNNKQKDNENNMEVKRTEIAANPIADKKTNGIFEIYNTSITTNTGSTRIKAAVKNVSGTRTEEQFINIELLDKNNNELGIIKVNIPSLENGEATTISAESLKVYENIYDFKIK